MLVLPPVVSQWRYTLLSFALCSFFPPVPGLEPRASLTPGTLYTESHTLSCGCSLKAIYLGHFL